MDPKKLLEVLLSDYPYEVNIHDDEPAATVLDAYGAALRIEVSMVRGVPVPVEKEAPETAED